MLTPQQKAELKQKLEKAEGNEKAYQKKIAGIEEKKNTAKAKVKIDGEEQEISYKEIEHKLYEYLRKYGSIGTKLSDVHSYLKSRTSGFENRQSLENLESLLAAKQELEKQHPEFKSERYSAIIGSDSNVKYVQVPSKHPIDE